MNNKILIKKMIQLINFKPLQVVLNEKKYEKKMECILLRFY